MGKKEGLHKRLYRYLQNILLFAHGDVQQHWDVVDGDNPITVGIGIEERLSWEMDGAKDMAEKNGHVIDTDDSV